VSSRIDPRLAQVLELMTEAESLIDSGRISDGLDCLKRAEQQLAGFMDLDLEQWREQSEFLP
jgi:hypothetical protein